MVWYRIVDYFSGPPKLPEGEPTKLPDYFPLEPKGCEQHAQKLFSCISEKATAKARDMEKAGLHKSYFEDVQVQPGDENAAKLVQENMAALEKAKANKEEPATLPHPDLPQPGDNPLDQCRTAIAYYQRCCDRELKKKQNWILTEPYRVQEEYRYQAKGNPSE